MKWGVEGGVEWRYHDGDVSSRWRRFLKHERENVVSCFSSHSLVEARTRWTVWTHCVDALCEGARWAVLTVLALHSDGRR